MVRTISNSQVRQKKKTGPKSKLSHKLIKEAYRLALLGMRDKDMAIFFQVHESTFENWKKYSPELVKSLHRGKDRADAKVVNSLYKRACGYSHIDTHFTTVKSVDAKGSETARVIATPYIKHYPPETNACKYWLGNRQRTRWTEVHRIESNVNVNVREQVDLSDFSMEELALLKNMGLKQLVPNDPSSN